MSDQSNFPPEKDIPPQPDDMPDDLATPVPQHDAEPKRPDFELASDIDDSDQPEAEEPEREIEFFSVSAPGVGTQFDVIDDEPVEIAAEYDDEALKNDDIRKEHPEEPREPERDFEDLTLSEMVGRLLRKPAQTLGALTTVLMTRDTSSESESLHLVVPDALPGRPRQPRRRPLREVVRDRDMLGDINMLRLGFYIVSLLSLWYGCARFVQTGQSINGARSEDRELAAGLLPVGFGLFVWFCIELGVSGRAIANWLRKKDLFNLTITGLRVLSVGMVIYGITFLMNASDENVVDVTRILSMVGPGAQWILAGIVLWLVIDLAMWLTNSSGSTTTVADEAAAGSDAEPVSAAEKFKFSRFLGRESDDIPWYMEIHPARIFLVLAGASFSLVTWMGTSGNQFQAVAGIHDFTLYMWWLSILCWALAFTPRGWTPWKTIKHWYSHISSFRIGWSNAWLIAALVGIMVIGGAFRLSRLNGDPATGGAIPPEMTSDHVEKILDSNRVLNGSRDIFFANNGGREPVQMYLMAIFSQFPGQSMGYHTLKLLAVIEGMLALPVMFWLGREITGDDRRRLGTIVGLLLAALVAVSYWHTTVTRLALRIILTPTITALTLIYLARGMRRNQRADFIKAGLCLGAGLYMYQAVRMLPVVILAAMAITIYFGARSWMQRLKYAANLAVLVLIAGVIFLPMFHYTTEQPEQFMRRTLGRLLGDDIITEKLPDGSIIERYATFQEQLTAFTQNVPVLLSNIRNAVLMFNWKGDVAWINGLPNYPAMDEYTGALLLAGCAAWLVLMIRRRDVVHWLMPVMLLIMLMPSALSIAYPIENPSFTRTSGALPVAYLLAAYPLALVVDCLILVLPGWRGKLSGALAAVVIVLLAYNVNTHTYFDPDEFPKWYIDSSLPYSDAGRYLQGFAISNGTYGNAFMMGYQYWWDHRAVGLEAGLTDWPNGIVNLSDVPMFMRTASLKTDRYRFDPDKDILFFYSRQDVDADAQFKEWFPTGRAVLQSTYQAGDEYMTYQVPALGEEGFHEFLRKAGAE